MFFPMKFRTKFSKSWLWPLLLALALSACDHTSPPPGVEGTIDGPKALVRISRNVTGDFAAS